MSNTPKEPKNVLDFFSEYLRLREVENDPEAEFWDYEDPGYSHGLPAALSLFDKKIDPEMQEMSVGFIERYGAWTLKLFQRARENPSRENLQRSYFARRVCDECQENSGVKCFILFDESGVALRPLFLCEKHRNKRAVEVPHLIEELDETGGPLLMPEAPTLLVCQRCGYEWTRRGGKEPLACPKCRSYKWDKPREPKR